MSCRRARRVEQVVKEREGLDVLLFASRAVPGREGRRGSVSRPGLNSG